VKFIKTENAQEKLKAKLWMKGMHELMSLGCLISTLKVWKKEKKIMEKN
jgi:hypothetical protein